MLEYSDLFFLQLWRWDLRGAYTQLVKKIDRQNFVSTLQRQDDRILVPLLSTSWWRHKMAVQVYHAVGVKILCFTLIGCGGVFIIMFVMNLPDSYTKCAWYFLQPMCMVPCAWYFVQGTFCSQWPRGCFSVLVKSDDFRSNWKWKLEQFQAIASFSLSLFWSQSLNMFSCVNYTSQRLPKRYFRLRDVTRSIYCV